MSAHYSPHPDPPRDGSLVTTGSGRLTGSCEPFVLFVPCRMSVGILPRLISCLFFALIHQSIVQSNQCDALDLLLCFFCLFCGVLSVSSFQSNRLVASLLTSNQFGCLEHCIVAHQNILNEQQDFVIFEKKK